MSMMILSCTRGTEEGAGRRRERFGGLGLTSDEILGQGNIDAADLNVCSTSPPGLCNKVVVGYHSHFENGNPSLSSLVGLFPNAHQQSPFPAKLERPMKGSNYHTKKQ
jgi:hypothetical protein